MTPDSLRGHVIAIDTSIWLVQFLKAMRDESGNMIRGAHLVGFFRRICKLLYYGIRPVFVFDGPPPPLKLKTLLQRRQLQEQQQIGLKKTAEKILLNQLKLRAITHARTRRRRPDLAAEKTEGPSPGPSNMSPGETPAVDASRRPFVSSGQRTPSSGRLSPAVSLETSVTAPSVTQGVDSASGEVSPVEQTPKLYDSSAPDPALFPDIEEDQDEALTNAAARRARRVAYYNSIPQEFTGFLAGRRRLDDIQVNACGLENILSMPTLTRAKRSVDGQGPPQLSRLFLAEDEFKEYCVRGEHGAETFISLPLDSSVDPEVFASLPSKLQYSILNQVRDAWFNETRFRAIQSKDNPEVFSNIQIESFLRHVNTTKEIAKAKKAMADQVHAAVSSLSSSAVNHFGSPGREGSYSSTTHAPVAGSPVAKQEDPFGTSLPASPTGSPVSGPALQLPVSGIVKPITREEDECATTKGVSRRFKPASLHRGRTFEAALQRQLAVTSLEPLPQLKGVSRLTKEGKLGMSGWSTLKGEPCLAWEEMRRTLNSSTAKKEEPQAVDAEVWNTVEPHQSLKPATSAGGGVTTPAFILPTCSDLSRFEGDEDALYTHLSPTDLFENLSSTPQLPRRLRASSCLSSSPLSQPAGSDFPPVSGENGGVESKPPFSETPEVSTPYSSSVPTFSVKRIKLVKKLATSGAPVSALPPDSSPVMISAASPTEPHTTPALSLPPGAAAVAADQDLDEWGSWEAPALLPARSDSGTVSPVLLKKVQSADRPEDVEDWPLAPALTSPTVMGAESAFPLLPRGADDAPEDTLLRSSTATGTASREADRLGPSVEESFKQAVASSSSSSAAATELDEQSPRKPASRSGSREGPATAVSGAMPSAPLTAQMIEQPRRGPESEISSSLASVDKAAHDLAEEKKMLDAEFLMYKRDADQVTPEMQEEIKHLLSLFGIPYLDAPAEAEAQCAVLTELGLCEGVISDDSDAVVFGAQNVYRRFFETRSTVELYDLRHIETHLKLTKHDLILIAMLLGCDYTPGVSGIGIVNSLEAIRVFSGLDGLAELRDWATDTARVKHSGVRPEDSPEKKQYKEKHKGYRSQWVFPDLFPNPDVWSAFETPVVDRASEPFSWDSVHADGIVRLLQQSTALSRDTILATLNPVTSQHLRNRASTQARQTKITSYFTPIRDDERVAHVRSKRLQKVLPGPSSSKTVREEPRATPRPVAKDAAQAATVGHGSAAAASSCSAPPSHDTEAVPPNARRAPSAASRSRNVWERLAATVRVVDQTSQN